MLNTINLKIIDTSIQLICPTVLNKVLSQVYAPYVIKNDQLIPQFTLEISMVNGIEPTRHLLEKSIGTWHKNSYLIDDNGFVAILDYLNGRGKLTINEFMTIQKINFCLIQILSLSVLKKGGLLIHAAGLVKQAKAYIFLGHSGSGKSTVAGLLSGLRVLNDDIIGILPDELGWYAYPTPFWHAKQIRPSAQTEPVIVSGIYQLLKDTKVEIVKLSLAQSIAVITCSTSILANNPDLARQVMDVSSRITQTIPVFDLHFRKDNTFWSVIG